MEPLKKLHFFHFILHRFEETNRLKTGSVFLLSLPRSSQKPIWKGQYFFLKKREILLCMHLQTLFGKRGLVLVLFVRLFDLCLFGFVGFHLVSGRGCGL